MTKEDNTFDSGKKYLGIYTFLIKLWFPTIEFSALFVDSVIKDQSTFPHKKYIVKLSISERNSRENTTVNTHIIKIGFKIVQNIPSTDRR